MHVAAAERGRATCSSYSVTSNACFFKHTKKTKEELLIALFFHPSFSSLSRPLCCGDRERTSYLLTSYLQFLDRDLQWPSVSHSSRQPKTLRRRAVALSSFLSLHLPCSPPTPLPLLRRSGGETSSMSILNIKPQPKTSDEGEEEGHSLPTDEPRASPLHNLPLSFVTRGPEEVAWRRNRTPLRHACALESDAQGQRATGAEAALHGRICLRPSFFHNPLRPFLILDCGSSSISLPHATRQPPPLSFPLCLALLSPRPACSHHVQSNKEETRGARAAGGLPRARGRPVHCAGEH